MRYALLLSVFILAARSQVPSPAPGENGHGKKKESPAQKKQIGQHDEQGQASPFTINQFYPEQNDREKRESGSEQKHGAFLDFINTASTVLLAIFTLFLAGATTALSIVAHYQWRTMQGHEEALKGMAEHMNDGLTETRKAAKAAETSAEAAMINAQAVIKSERPWLLVSIVFCKPHNLDSEDTYMVQAFNAGRTPAELHEGHCAFEKHSIGFTEPPGDFQDPFHLPMQNLIVSKESFEIRELVPETHISQEDKDGMGVDPQALYVYGRIYYWDVFADRTAPGAKPYVTQWLFRYDSASQKFCRCAGGYAKNT